MLKFFVVIAGLAVGIACDSASVQAGCFKKKNKSQCCSAPVVQQSSCGGCGNSSMPGYQGQYGQSYGSSQYGSMPYYGQPNGQYSQPGMSGGGMFGGGMFRGR